MEKEVERRLPGVSQPRLGMRNGVNQDVGVAPAQMLDAEKIERDGRQQRDRQPHPRRAESDAAQPTGGDTAADAVAEKRQPGCEQR